MTEVLRQYLSWSYDIYLYVIINSMDVKLDNDPIQERFITRVDTEHAYLHDV